MTNFVHALVSLADVLTTGSVASYYASLSICSYVSVKNKFREEKYYWIEKWIHLACIIPSLIACIWLSATENINPSGSSCFAAAYPTGCQSDPAVLCERGGGAGFAVIVIGTISVVVYFIIPPCSMLAVYILVRKFKKEYQSSKKGMKQIVEAARKQMLRDVLLQISLYLFAFWATYIIALIQYVVNTVTGELSYNLLIVSNAIACSQGFIVMMVYFQLQRRSHRDKVDDLPQNPVCVGRHRDSDVRIIRTRAKSTVADRSNEVVESCTQAKSEYISRAFNIFDGTPDESSPWAQFIDQDITEFRSRC